jgi:hypothetical protein
MRSDEVWGLPEFAALMKRLGIQVQPTLRFQLTLEIDKMAVVVQEFMVDAPEEADHARG